MKKQKKKPEKVPHEVIRTNEHFKYEEEPVMAEKSSFEEEVEEED